MQVFAFYKFPQHLEVILAEFILQHRFPRRLYLYLLFHTPTLARGERKRDSGEDGKREAEFLMHHKSFFIKKETEYRGERNVALGETRRETDGHKKSR